MYYFTPSTFYHKFHQSYIPDNFVNCIGSLGKILENPSLALGGTGWHRVASDQMWATPLDTLEFTLIPLYSP